MRKIKWLCETGYSGCEHEGEIEVEDDETEEAIEAMVAQEVYNCISWTWWEEEK